MAKTWGKLIQEIKTKKAVTQCWLNAASQPFSRQSRSVANKKTAPNVNGRACINRDLEEVFKPFWRCDHPLILCCPIKYRPNAVSKGSCVLRSNVPALSIMAGRFSNIPQRALREARVTATNAPSTSVSGNWNVLIFRRIALLSDAWPSKRIDRSEPPQIRLLAGVGEIGFHS